MRSIIRFLFLASIFSITGCLKNSDGFTSNPSTSPNPNAPSVSITSPTANTVTASTILLQGSCDSSVSTVNISGASPASTACSSGSFSQSITLSGADGGKNVTVSQTNSDGTGSDNRSFIFDTTAPTSTSISINSGAGFTNSTSATLTLAATDANSGIQMYVTNTSGCSSGGSWESFNVSKSWTLGQTNVATTVYVKYRDSVNNESSCISDTIIHDNIAPSVAITSPSASSVYQSGLTLQGNCTDGITVNISGDVTTSTTTCSGGAFSKAITLSTGEGNKTVQISQTDLASNSDSDSRIFIRDNTAPSNTTYTDPTSNQNVSTNSYTFQWNAGSDANGLGNYKLEVFNNNNCSGSPASTVFEASTSKAVTLATGDNTVKLYVVDVAGNESTGVCSSVVNYQPTPIVIYHAGASTGNIGNRATADTRCVTYKPVGVTQANVRAFISYNVTDEIRDMPTNYSVPTNVPIEGPTGVLLANSWTDMAVADFVILNNLQSVALFAGEWWSGTDSTLQVFSFTCNSWTSNSAFVEGNYGSTASTFPWIYVSTSNMWCNNSRYLLCIAFD